MSNISFVSSVEFLDSLDECRPRPAKNFIPEWFKNIPVDSGRSTVKNCPSFPDYFSQGYVVPMWADFKLKLNKEENLIGVEGPGDVFTWAVHGSNQFIDYVNPNFSGVGAEFVFKADCPWNIITPPGWSVLQLPLFYHFNKEWSVMPGIIDTDVHHEINQQVLYHSDKDEVIIKRGDPFALYIPFKREKHSFDVRYQTEKDRKILNKNKLDLATKFIGSGVYRKMQRDGKR
jgi:hypothetical protein